MKETYTIYIMPSSKDGTRHYSIRRWSIISLISLFSLVIIGAIGCIIWANWLNLEMYQKDKEYRSLETEYRAWKTEFDSICKEMASIRERYSSIREILGLEEGGLNVSGLGQGGSGGGADEYIQDTPENMPLIESPTLPATDENKNLSLMDQAKALNVSLHEINEYIVTKKEDWLCTPTINPIQKDTFWYSSGFGYRTHPLTGKRDFHKGLDISARRGSPISAAAKGVVKSMKKDRYLGFYIVIRHDSTYSTLYGHLKQFAAGLKVDDKVSRESVIGYVGDTGRTTGNHLHYEVHVNGKVVNPKDFILDK